jgi:streptogramin lyase
MAVTRCFRTVVPLAGLCALAAGPVHAQAPAAGELFVANLSSHSVAAVSIGEATEALEFVPPGAGGLAGATGISLGPDGLLYVSSSGSHQVLRYDPDSGAHVDVFVDDPRLRMPFSVVFGPTGDLFVTSGRTHEVLRFDGRSGEFIAAVAGAPVLEVPIGLRFDADGRRLYVASAGRNAVVEVDPAGIEPPRDVVTEGLDFPSDVLVCDDGTLLVSNAFAGTIDRYDPETGRHVSTFAALPGEGGVPVGLASDGDGGVYIADFGRDRIYRVQDGTVEAVALEGLDGPENLVFRPTRAPVGGR